MRLTLKEHRDAMVAMLANGNCPTSAARLAHALHDVLSYLQDEPEAPVAHSERREEATTPGLNDKLLAFDLEAHRKPQPVNQQVKELQLTVKHRDNTIKQLKGRVADIVRERDWLKSRLEEALNIINTPATESFEQEQAGVRKEDTEVPDDGWVEWGGGDCPVGEGVYVAVKFRAFHKAHEGENGYPEFWDWGHTGSSGDIIAYRVVKP